MKLFHCKHLLCLRKERLHIPTLFFYFLFSAPAFLVPATVSCARIPGVFIDNRMCLININTFFIFNLKYVADLTFILRTFWLGTDLTGADWGRFDLESIWLEIEKSLCVKSFLKKYCGSQCCWKKYSDFGGGKKNNLIQSFYHIT
jgi:hypothetical protein